MGYTTEEMQIAQFMLEKYSERNRLSQSVAVRLVREKFGHQFSYRNKNGNWALNKGILEAFKDLTPTGVVWSRSNQTWRERRPNDPTDSRMVP